MPVQPIVNSMIISLKVSKALADETRLRIFQSIATAFHTNAPPEDGRGVRRVMELALEDAGLAPPAIQYLNAHATSTQLGDRAEAKAICDAFGDHAESLLVSSTKSMTGHLLGAAGSLEAGLTVLALRDQVAPPTTTSQSSKDFVCGV
jgi:3-oxoacyl-[acyl-carrier-protein] synthase II